MVAVVCIPVLSTVIASAFYRGLNDWTNVRHQNMKLRYSPVLVFVIIVIVLVTILF